MDPPEDKKKKTKSKGEEAEEEEEESWCAAIRPDDAVWPEEDGPWCDDDDDSRLQFPDSRFHQFPESTVGVPICSAADMGGGGSTSTSMPADEYRQLHLGRQESLELLAESWAQLAVPDPGGGEIEAYSHEELRHFQEDLEQFLFVDPGDSETMSTSSLSIGGDTDRDSDPAVVTSSGESSLPSPGGMLKRKERLLGCESPPQQPPSHQEPPESPIDKQLKKLKGSEQALPRTRPRYAIQTRTEVDVIDDGYRWRKYGQKPVKNSAHPRNYYRCTTANCPVRKRVERSTENPSHVLTTYDGTHTHPENVAAQRELSSANPLPSDAPRPQPLGPPRLPPSNYIAPNIIGHLLAAGAQAPLDQRRWSGGTSTSGSPPIGGGSGTFLQQSLNVLRAHQFFRLRYGTQYPLLSNMLNLMRNFQTRPPAPAQLMDPLAALMAAQSYYAMHGGPSPNLGLPANQQPGTSTRDPVSMQQRRLLWIQALMDGENLLNVEGPLSSSPPPAGQPQHRQPMPSDNLQGEDGQEDDPDNLGDEPT